MALRQFPKIDFVEEATSATSIFKSRVGRPKKSSNKKIIDKKGISEPIGKIFAVEFLYDDPNIFKKIINFFKAAGASSMQMLFKERNIYFYAQDHSMKSHIRVRIDCTKVNHYYANDKSGLDIGINLSMLESVVGKIDKEYNSISIMSKNDTKRASIIVSFDTSICIEEASTIALISQYEHLTPDLMRDFDDDKYTIKFEWPCKYFKKTVNDIKEISKQFAIIQDSYQHNPKITFDSETSDVRNTYTIAQPEKINFKSDLIDDESFRVDLRVEYLKPISNAHIATSAIIMVDEKKPFKTKAYIDDGVIEIITLTDIIRETV